MCTISGMSSSIDPKNLVCKPESQTPFKINKSDDNSKNEELSFFKSKIENSKVQNFGYDNNSTPMLSFPTQPKIKSDKPGLKIEVTDTNGFGDIAPNGVNDIKIKANGSLKISKESILNLINTGTGVTVSESWTGDARLGKASFDKDDKEYYIPIKSFLDDFGISVKTEGNKLVIRTENTQLAGLKDVLGKIEGKIKDAHLPFKVVRHEVDMYKGEFDDRIELVPDFKGTAISKSINLSSSNISEKNTKLNFDNEGNLHIELNNVEMQGKEIGNAKEKTSGDPDHASITIGEEIKIKKGKENHVVGDVEVNVVDGDVSLTLDKKESDFNLNELNLGRQFSDTKANIDNIHGKITVKTDKVRDIGLKTSTIDVENVGGNLSLDLKGAERSVKINGEIDASLESKTKKLGGASFTQNKADFELKNTTISTDFKYKSGIHEGNNTQMDIKAGVDEHGNITFNPKVIKTDAKIDNTLNKPSHATLELITGSDGAFKKLKERAETAKESISIESFMMSGKPAQELSEILARKASQGVKVNIILDSQFGDKKDTKGINLDNAKEDEYNGGIMILNKAKNDLIKKYNDDPGLKPEKKKELIDNINKNLDWRVLENGMMRIDHRKIWIIDGKQAIAGGGVNLTQSAIVGSQKGDGTLNPPKHDSMYEIHGPTVRNLQQGFIDFWNKNSEKPMPDADQKVLVKSEKELETEMLKHKKGNSNLSVSNAQVLYTDENKKQVYQKMIDEVNKAEKSINLEHAYLDHPELQKALENAVARGVTVNILMPEESDEQDFIKFNNYNAIESLRNKANEQGSKGKVNAYFYKNDIAFNHSKLMTFDGKSAIVGSANTTSRSLDNPVHYNKEMALFVEDDKFVKSVDADLFEKDIKESSIDLQNPDNWEKFITKNKAKIEKYKNIDGAS